MAKQIWQVKWNQNRSGASFSFNDIYVTALKAIAQYVTNKQLYETLSFQ